MCRFYTDHFYILFNISYFSSFYRNFINPFTIVNYAQFWGTSKEQSGNYKI